MVKGREGVKKKRGLGIEPPPVISTIEELGRFVFIYFYLFAAFFSAVAGTAAAAPGAAAPASGSRSAGTIGWADFPSAGVDIGFSTVPGVAGTSCL